MLSTAEKWKLYISSYLPLYLLILIKEYKQVIDATEFIANPTVSNLFVYLIFTVLLYSIYLIGKIFFGRPTKTYRIKGEFEPVTDSIMSYVMTYIIPLISVDFTEPITLVTNILLFLFIGIIYVKNDLIYLNPLISVSHNIYINGKNIVISKFSLEQLKRFEKENTKLIGKQLSGNVVLYQKLKK